MKDISEKNIFLRKVHLWENFISEKITFLRNPFNQARIETALANFQIHASISGDSSPSLPS